jgi:(1->4)-alpha-D-glucan 1-alpha-D-glucosylmutase
VAFTRGTRVVTVVPRLVLGLARRGGFGTTTLDLPPGRWTNVLTGEAHHGGPTAVHALLGGFPVALLREGSAP